MRRNIVDELTEENEKLKRANKALTNRCFALTRGVMCIFCELDCSRRTKKFLDDDVVICHELEQIKAEKKRKVGKDDKSKQHWQKVQERRRKEAERRNAEFDRFMRMMDLMKCDCSGIPIVFTTEHTQEEGE